MSIVLVGQAAGGSYSTSRVQAYSSTAGNLLVLLVLHQGGTVSSVTDTAGNTWTKAADSQASSGATAQGAVDIWYAANAAHVTSVTATVGTQSALNTNISEWSGAAASSVVRNAATSYDLTSSSHQSATTVAASVGDLVVGVLGYVPDTGTARTDTIASPYVGLTGANVSNTFLSGAYHVAVGTEGPAWNFSVGSSKRGAATVAFKSDAPAPPPTIEIAAQVNIGGTLTNYTGRLNLAGTLKPFGPPAGPPPAAPNVIQFSDFTQGQTGMFLGSTSLVGAGVDKTTYQMVPNSSTHAAEVNALADYQTNQYDLMRAGEFTSSAGPSGLEVGNFTLQATDQGHEFGGLNLGRSTGASVHDLNINGIPGSTGFPPGETFTLGTYHPTSPHFQRVHLDGRNAAGTPVAASLFGYNFNTGTSVCDDCTAQYAQYGFAAALWRCEGSQVFNNCDFRFCNRALNIEQAIGGSYDFNSCDFRGTWGKPYIAQISSITTSSVITFRDPVVDAYPVKVARMPQSSTNLQQDSDIHCYINGVNVTGDTSKFQIVSV